MVIKKVADLVAFLQTCDQEQKISFEETQVLGYLGFGYMAKSPKVLTADVKPFVPNPFVQFMLNVTCDKEYASEYLEEGDSIDNYEFPPWSVRPFVCDHDANTLVQGQGVLGWNTAYFRRTVTFVRNAWLLGGKKGLAAAEKIGDEKVREEILGWLATKNTK
ncbi:MAG: hypothetical protein V3T23_07150 [Nitrososphaerales archaeon]